MCPCGVHIAGEVAVVVADEMRRVEGPSVLKTVVEGACHVAQDSLDGLQMLHRRLLHELAHVPEGKREIHQVWTR